jgi:hypothetical protein
MEEPRNHKLYIILKCSIHALVAHHVDNSKDLFSPQLCNTYIVLCVVECTLEHSTHNMRENS